MAECQHCESTGDLFYTCSYCGGIYCPDHRLPEGHDCDGVEFLSATGKRFENKMTGRVVRTGEPIERPEPIEPNTVGTRIKPEYPSPPPVEVKSADEHPDEPAGPLLDRFLKWLRG